jgi:hypothetical protein
MHRSANDVSLLTISTDKETYDNFFNQGVADEFISICNDIAMSYFYKSVFPVLRVKNVKYCALFLSVHKL